MTRPQSAPEKTPQSVFFFFEQLPAPKMLNSNRREAHLQSQASDRATSESRAVM